jgi:hypothetical protein
MKWQWFLSSPPYPGFCLVDTGVLFQWQNGQGAKLTAYLHLVSWLRFLGMLPPHIYIFTVWCTVRAVLWRSTTSGSCRAFDSVLLVLVAWEQESVFHMRKAADGAGSSPVLSLFGLQISARRLRVFLILHSPWGQFPDYYYYYYYYYYYGCHRLCGLVVRVPGYRSRGSRRY